MNKEKEIFENKPIFKAIMNLAIPAIIGQLILVIYNLADTFFVGLTKDDSLITAVTICMPAFMFLSAISNLFGVGASSVISRSLGKQNIKRASNASSFAFYGCLLISALYCLFTFLFSDAFVNILGGSNELVHNLSKNYIFISVFLCGIPTCLSTLFSHLIRAQGKSLEASLGIVIGGVLNIILDPLFMFVIFKNQPASFGAALATGLSNVFAMIYYIIVFIVMKNKLLFSIRFNKEMFKNNLPSEVLVIGLPACLMTLCENISYAILDNLMSQVSLIAQTGIGVAKKVNMFAHSLVRGMTQGVLPLIGYNKSSGNRTRMKKVVFESMLISFIIALSCTTISILFAKELTSIFIQDKTTGSFEYGIKFLRILCIGAPFSALAYTIISFFQAVGKAWRSLILALLRKGILDIPLMFILINACSPYGIVIATPIADFICCITSLILFFLYLKYHGKDKIKEKKLIMNN